MQSKYPTKPQLVFVTGPTNAGKTTLLEEADKHSQTHAVEVGKYMRAKYPPSYFAGQCNPKHTAVEAWQAMLDMIEQAPEEAVCILIDGQPRDLPQAADCLELEYDQRYINLYAPYELRLQRALDRDGGLGEESRARLFNELKELPPTKVAEYIVDYPDRLQLSVLRLINDYKGAYEVISYLLKFVSVETVDTSGFDLGEDYEALVNRLVSERLYGKVVNL